MDDYESSVFGNTSSTSAMVGEFEVFLSFRGIDTRKSFADYLCNDLVDAGIRTFRDDDELRVGEKIGPELIKAIEESKICIPIFSQNYASSKWCLLELAQIVECKRSTGQKILPIFYNVVAYDVRHQTGSYEEAFRRHEKDKRFDKETVQRWNEALKEVGELKGWEFQKETNGHQEELVKIVVEEVLLELKKSCMVVTDNLIGTDHHIEEMKRLLNVDSNDVPIVGIHGMGGIGKTTIAKVIYNQLFERIIENFPADSLHSLHELGEGGQVEKTVTSEDNVHGEEQQRAVDQIDSGKRTDMYTKVNETKIYKRCTSRRSPDQPIEQNEKPIEEHAEHLYFLLWLMIFVRAGLEKMNMTNFCLRGLSDKFQ